MMKERAPLKHSPSKAKMSHKEFWHRFGLSISVIGAGVAAVLGGQLAGGWFSEVWLAPFSGLTGTSELFVRYALTQAVVIGLLVVVAFAFRAKLSQLGIGKVKDWTYFLLLPLIYLATLLASVFVSIAVMMLVPDYNASQAQNLGLPPVHDGNLWVTGLFLVVAVPLAEEFIFRGYLFGLLRQYMSFWWVAVVVSIIFAAAHGQWNVAINVFILSLALCYIREKTGSIWTGVGLHALKNFIAFLLLFVYNVA